jgi:lambda repressor-like predicted transcriptional regulator
LQSCPARSSHDRAAITLNRDSFFQAMRDAGIALYALADHIRVHKSTVSRVLNGRTAPGEEFIAATLAAFPDAKFEDLFQVRPQT